jgi:hypothetical protein
MAPLLGILTLKGLVVPKVVVVPCLVEVAPDKTYVLDVLESSVTVTGLYERE